MSKLSVEELFNRLLPYKPQAIHQLFRDPISQGTIRICWNFGRGAAPEQSLWIDHAAGHSNLSLMAIVCVLAAQHGRMGTIWSEFVHLIDIFLEEHQQSSKKTSPLPPLVSRPVDPELIPDDQAARLDAASWQQHRHD